MTAAGRGWNKWKQENDKGVDRYLRSRDSIAQFQFATGWAWWRPPASPGEARSTWCILGRNLKVRWHWLPAILRFDILSGILKVALRKPDCGSGFVYLYRARSLMFPMHLWGDSKNATCAFSIGILMSCTPPLCLGSPEFIISASNTVHVNSRSVSASGTRSTWSTYFIVPVLTLKQPSN